VSKPARSTRLSSSKPGLTTITLPTAADQLFRSEMKTTPPLRLQVRGLRWVLPLVLVSMFHFGGLLAVAAVPVQPPLTPDSLRQLVADHKVTPDQAKILQTDLDLVAAAEKKLADFVSQTPPAQLKVKPGNYKYQGLQRELEVEKHRLASDQAKFTAVAAKPSPTPTAKSKH
jgi:hypothetical protein